MLLVVKDEWNRWWNRVTGSTVLTGSGHSSVRETARLVVWPGLRVLNFNTLIYRGALCSEWRISIRWPRLAVSVMQRYGVHPSVRPSVCTICFSNLNRARCSYSTYTWLTRWQHATRPAYISVRVLQFTRTYILVLSVVYNIKCCKCFVTGISAAVAY